MLEYQIRTTRGIGPVTPNPAPDDDRRVVPFRRPGAPRWQGVAPRPGPVPPYDGAHERHHEGRP